MLKITDLKSKLQYAATKVVPAFAAAGEVDIARQISTCGDVVTLAVCRCCGQRHYAGANKCRSRYCPTCAKLRAMLWLAKLIPLFDDWLQSGRHICMMNLTIKDTERLEDGLNILIRAWQYMANSRSRRAEWQKRFAGGVRSLEVKLGDNSRLWHPHLHCIVLKDSYSKDYDYILEAWEKGTRIASNLPGKQGSVWLKGFNQRNAGTGELMQGIVETFKYMTKFDFFSASPEQIRELVKSLYRKHGIQTWGCLRDFEKEVEKQMQDMDYHELRDYVCSRCGMSEFDFENVLRADFLGANDISDLRKV